MFSKRSDIEAYVKLIRTADALHAQVSQGLAAERLTASQFSTLKALRLHGPMPQKDVAAFLIKTPGNVTLVLDNLERNGLVVRERQVDDRRLVHVRLTPRGVNTFDRIYPAHIQRIAAAMRDLDPGELDALTGLLHRLHTTVNDPRCSPDPPEEAGSPGAPRAPSQTRRGRAGKTA